MQKVSLGIIWSKVVGWLVARSISFDKFLVRYAPRLFVGRLSDILFIMLPLMACGAIIIFAAKFIQTWLTEIDLSSSSLDLWLQIPLFLADTFLTIVAELGVIAIMFGLISWYYSRLKDKARDGLDFYTSIVQARPSFLYFAFVSVILITPVIVKAIWEEDNINWAQLLFLSATVALFFSITFKLAVFDDEGRGLLGNPFISLATYNTVFFGLIWTSLTLETKELTLPAYLSMLLGLLFLLLFVTGRWAKLVRSQLNSNFVDESHRSVWVRFAYTFPLFGMILAMATIEFAKQTGHIEFSLHSCALDLATENNLLLEELKPEAKRRILRYFCVTQSHWYSTWPLGFSFVFAWIGIQWILPTGRAIDNLPGRR